MRVREIFDLVLDQLRGIWRFRWIALIAAWLVCAVGWTLVMTVPAKYEASAQVYVDTRSILKPLLQGLAINPDVATGLDLVRQILLSSRQLEQVAHNTALDQRVVTPEDRAVLVALMRSRITIEAADARARSNQGDGLYRIAFIDPNRTKSIEVVRKMLDAFVENAIGGQRVDQESTDQFFASNISEIENRLRDMELKKADFLKRHINELPETQADYVTQMQAANGSVDTARNALRVAMSRQVEIDRQLSGSDPYLFGLDGGTGTSGAGGGDLTARIQGLEKQLDDLLLQFTEKYPTVVDLRRTIDTLKQRQQEELDRIRAGERATGSLASSLKSNPVYQNLQMEQKKNSIQIAELKQDLVQRVAKVDELKAHANEVPQVAADLVALNRDYDQLTQTYNEMIKRRETASLTKAADKTSTAKFKVIEPAAADFRPTSPNRPLLLSLVLAFALAVGAAVGWLLNQLRPVFYTEKNLAAIAGRVVIASVGRTWVKDHRARLRIELRRMSVAAVGLVLAFGAVITFASLR